MVRIIGIAALALIASSMRAQEPQFYSGPEQPRFGVGMDLFLPTFFMAVADNSHGIQAVVSYRSAEKRSWRLGYGFWREEYDGGPYWSFQDSLATATQSGHYQRIHQVNLGRQWERGAGRIRTTVGAELLVAYQEFLEQDLETTYVVDTVALPMIRLGPSRSNYETHYVEQLAIGPAAYGGIEARVHKHLSIQLRVGAAYLIKVPLHQFSNTTYTPFRTDRINFLPMGSGLFVQFLF